MSPNDTMGCLKLAKKCHVLFEWPRSKRKKTFTDVNRSNAIWPSLLITLSRLRQFYFLLFRLHILWCPGVIFSTIL
jgi:hypothetical protein